MFCPSSQWEAHLDSVEGPEECPVCGAANYDEDAEEWLCPEHEGFCSKACADKYEEQCKEEHEAELAQDAHDRLEESEHAQFQRIFAELAEHAKVVGPITYKVGSHADPKTPHILEMFEAMGYTIKKVET